MCRELGGFSVITKTYRRVKDVELKIRIYIPENSSFGNKKPAIVFYFGGGWIRGDYDRFKMQASYFASKGFVVFTPEYRIKNKHNTTPVESVQDGLFALEWIVNHNEDFGIDTDAIVLGGGSAGGHIALCVAMKSDCLGCNDTRIGALLLFNPVVDTGKDGYGMERFGSRALEFSPMHNISTNLPPCIIFHGTEDKVVSFKKVQEFCKKMSMYGNDCEVVPYEGRGHGFFNFKDSKEENFCYYDTIARAEEFLKQKGIVR